MEPIDIPPHIHAMVPFLRTCTDMHQVTLDNIDMVAVNDTHRGSMRMVYKMKIDAVCEAIERLYDEVIDLEARGGEKVDAKIKDLLNP
jgi:hypothetical protein